METHIAIYMYTSDIYTLICTSIHLCMYIVYRDIDMCLYVCLNLYRYICIYIVCASILKQYTRRRRNTRIRRTTRARYISLSELNSAPNYCAIICAISGAAEYTYFVSYSRTRARARKTDTTIVIALFHRSLARRSA